MIRPGVTSRCEAMSSRVSHSARTAPRARRPRTRWTPDVRRQASWRTAGTKPRRCSNSWRAHSALPVSSSSAARRSRSSTRTSTSRAAYSSQAWGRGRVDQSAAECSFFIRKPEQGLDQGGQADAGVAEQPAGELGVEERVGVQADLVEAGQVLGGGVQDPLGAAQHLLQRGQGVERDRVDQGGAAAVAAQLEEVGALGVAVAGGALGVDRHRTGALGQPSADLGEGLLGLGDLGQAVGEGEQLGERRLDLLAGLDLARVGRAWCGAVGGFVRAHPAVPR